MNQDPFVAFLENSKSLQEECIFNAAYGRFIKGIRKTLDDSSKLAQSMDRHDAPDVMFKIAVELDQLGIAEIILINKTRKQPTHQS